MTKIRYGIKKLFDVNNGFFFRFCFVTRIRYKIKILFESKRFFVLLSLKLDTELRNYLTTIIFCLFSD